MLPEIVRAAALNFENRTVIDSDNNIHLSYKDLDLISDEVSGALLQRGLLEGSILLLSLPTSIEYLIIYIAASKIGVITAGVNPRFRASERKSICEITEPDLIIATSELSDGIPKDLSVEITEITENTEKLLAGLRSDSFQPKKLEENLDRAVCICFTSGSTGIPKGALFTNKELLAIQKMDTEGVWGSGGHLVPSTAFAHVGSMTKLPWQLSKGVTLHVLDRWKAEKVMGLIETHRISAIAGVSAQIALLLKVENFENYDLSCVRAIVAGGGPSPPSLVIRAKNNFNAPYSIRYSSTESGGIGLATSLE
ncbi:long-chain fatty acid--CoA ligase, partial [Acidimicrobiia bacterium]|nr:long-chain fatty acid--CoA ligase [Acidimicrobiia bacterium]